MRPYFAVILFFAISTTAHAGFWADIQKSDTAKQPSKTMQKQTLGSPASEYEHLVALVKQHEDLVRDNCIPVALVQPPVLSRGVTGSGGERANMERQARHFEAFKAIQTKWELVTAKFRSGDGSYDWLLDNLLSLESEDVRLSNIYADNMYLDGANKAIVSGARAVESWKLQKSDSASKNLAANFPGSTYQCYAGVGSINNGNEQTYYRDHRVYKLSLFEGGFSTEISPVHLDGEHIFNVSYSYGGGTSLASASIVFSKTGGRIVALNLPLDSSKKSGAVIMNAGKEAWSYDLSAKKIVQLSQKIYEEQYRSLGLTTFVSRLVVDEVFRHEVLGEMRAIKV